jgi:hypothetical protein
LFPIVTLIRVLALVLLALPLMLASPAAHAQTNQCTEQFDALEATIQGAESLNDKTRASFLGKAEDAQAKLAAGKPADAARKLDDLKSSLALLEQAGKVSSTDAAAIRAATDAALACVTAST